MCSKSADKYLNFGSMQFYIIIIIIILVITFMQGIYNYKPEMNHVSRVYSAPAVLYLQFVLHVMLFRPLNMFCTFTLAYSIVCVPCQKWLFL
jgi:membrane protein YdbS with pleckstrin-like domain